MTEFKGRLFAGRLFAGRLFRGLATQAVIPAQTARGPGGHAPRGRSRPAKRAPHRDDDDDVLLFLLR